MSSPKIPMQGSERSLLPGSRQIGIPDPNERAEITLVLTRPSSGDLHNMIEQNANLPLKARKYLTRKEFEEKFGVTKENIGKVETFAHENELDIVEINVAQSTIILSGTIAALSSAFDVKLATYQHSEGVYRGRTGPVHIPSELASIIDGVFGLDNRPQAKPHFRLLKKSTGLAQPHAFGASYTPIQIAELYGFPKDLDGTGQCVAIIELGGGYRIKELKTYFANLGIKNIKISAVSVDGHHNSPIGNPNKEDGEVVLDIEIVGAVAKGAQIVVYFSSSSDRGFLDAVGKAIHDDIHKPSVISISWGKPEAGWTPTLMQAFNQAFQSAAALGITVCAASGDDGSSDGDNDGLAHVDFPASSPYVLACGGTNVNSSANKIVDEAVWNGLPDNGATGGGISDFFDLPIWQANANVPKSVNPGGRVGRGVPDVAGDADPSTGYKILVDGENSISGGTSAVAPLYAALIAMINQGIGHAAGYLNPILYKLPPNSGVFQDITKGNNVGYQAKVGWDACTGLGRINGSKLLDSLKS